MYVCLFVCNGQLWRPEESTDFDETWQVGSYPDLVVCFWAPLLWTPPLPSNGTLKFLKNHKKIIFSKIKNRLPGFYAQYNQPFCQIFSARSVKNCMTSMQLCSDHPCRLPACWVVARVPLFSLFPSVCMYVMDSSGSQRSQPILMKLDW